MTTSPADPANAGRYERHPNRNTAGLAGVGSGRSADDLAAEKRRHGDATSSLSALI